jgi:hypothetical protein
VAQQGSSLKLRFRAHWGTATGFLARIDAGNTGILTWGKTQWRTTSGRLTVVASFPPSLAMMTGGSGASPTKDQSVAASAAPGGSP